MQSRPPFVTVVSNDYDEAEFMLRYKVVPPLPKNHDKKGRKKSPNKSAKNSSFTSSKNSQANTGSSSRRASYVESTNLEIDNSHPSKSTSIKSKRAKSPKKHFS
ncbi:hypothetical protein M9Y10_006117 [Tritrichomonas musculus]|uniref:Uncharacterized protein n=1 Tax=Tritrichomonas musculus TaxID=1915356 RepID=A0ABR2JDX7_9EUKA